MGCTTSGPAAAGALDFCACSGPTRRSFLHGTTSGGRVVENSHGMAGVGCAMCHGSDGRGGMMHGIPSPDITYSVLTDSKGHEHEFMNRRHPPFNRETIKAAIVAGI